MSVRSAGLENLISKWREWVFQISSSWATQMHRNLTYIISSWVVFWVRKTTGLLVFNPLWRNTLTLDVQVRRLCVEWPCVKASVYNIIRGWCSSFPYWIQGLARVEESDPSRSRSKSAYWNVLAKVLRLEGLSVRVAKNVCVSEVFFPSLTLREWRRLCSQ